MRRSAIAWLVAAVVPLLLLGIFYIGVLFQDRQHQTEERSLDRAGSYLERVDSRLAGDLGALTVLAGSRPILSGVADDARSQAILAANEFPSWKNVILTDVSTRESVWQTAAPAAPHAPARADALAFAARGAKSWIGGVREARNSCLCVPIHHRIEANGALFVLTVERNVADFHDLLVAQISPGEIAALVDREGLFIARTVENATRIGTPATQYVRQAVARGGEGVYGGVTYEGLRNRTAYVTSELSGWSTHIAVPATSYNLLSAGYATFALLAVAAALLFAGGVTWYGLHDLKLERRRERARMQSYKLEAIGALSSAVAHDFNNLLAIMAACLNILSTSEDPAKRGKVTQEARAAIDRSAQLVRQLLTFVRDKPLEISCVDLSVTIDGIRDLLVRILGHGITLEFKIPPEAQYVSTNGAQLELVLMNLAANARDAMPEGGKFSISSGKTPDQAWVDLMVKDTGVGMSTEVASRALEPFFTTKPEGKGTGLGLAQAQMLAKDSGGALSLETALGKGCLLTFRFPACRP